MTVVITLEDAVERVYSEDSSMREARARYFALSGFAPDGGYGDAWVHVKLGPLSLSIPNGEARLRAVRYHDLHHVITGYGTDWLGEFEISAWEIGAGCKGYAAAWMLNLGGMTGGLVAAPRRTFRAFRRGLGERTLYDEPLAQLLDQTVAQVRARVQRPNSSAKLTAAAFVLFPLACAFGVLAGGVIAVLGALATPILFSIDAKRAAAVARSGRQNTNGVTIEAGRPTEV